MNYTVKVKEQGRIFARRYCAVGHSITNFVQDKDKKLLQVGSPRLEIFLQKGGVVVYGDLTRVTFQLGKDWEDYQKAQMEKESAGVVKLADK